tara:strand:+ start:61 stop:315 length:255 start_codon:yes stop_codon:yes gene_type:complete
MIDSLIGILETHGIAGLMLGILSYIVISQLNTIKSMTKKQEDAMKIFAIKIEAKIDALSGDVADVDKSVAKAEGAREADMRRRR